MGTVLPYGKRAQDAPPSPSEVLGDWPTFGCVDDVRPFLAQAAKAGEACVLATLGSADGGAPFGVGAQMAFTRSDVSGFLSGGCIEADVALHAAEALEDGGPQRLVYGRGGAPDLRLPCGGRIALLLERIAPDDPALARLIALDHARQPALWLSDGRVRRCVASHDEPTPEPYATLAATELDAAMDEASGRLMRRHTPRQRLIVVGRDPIALALAEQGARMGWETTLARPGGPAAPPPLPGVGYVRGEVGAEMLALAPDPWTAVVVATHDSETDLGAARAAIASAAGYIGLLGSHRRWPRDLERIGGSDAALASGRVHAPVGLPIRARGPLEITVSVIAEIVADRRSRPASGTAAEGASA